MRCLKWERRSLRMHSARLDERGTWRSQSFGEAHVITFPYKFGPHPFAVVVPSLFPTPTTQAIPIFLRKAHAGEIISTQAIPPLLYVTSPLESHFVASYPTKFPLTLWSLRCATSRLQSTLAYTRLGFRRLRLLWWWYEGQCNSIRSHPFPASGHSDS